MKKALNILLLSLLVALNIQAQYFRGKVVLDNATAPTKLRFLIQPNPGGGNITAVLWDRFEMFVRVPTGGVTPTFGNITVNTTDFPGLSMTKGGLGTTFLNGWGDEPGFNIYYFPSAVPNNATSSTRDFVAGTEYEVFNVEVTAGSTDFEFAANQIDQFPYYFTLSRNTSGIGGEANMTAKGPLAGADAATNSVFYGQGLSNVGINYYQKAGVIVPVSFLNFFALKNGDDAKLSWTVENDFDNKYFEVERSIDGRVYTTLAKVNALNNGKSTNTYELADPRLSNLGSKIIYYRIKQVDNSGTITYSSIRNLNLTLVSTAINLFPNPARSTTKLVIDAEWAGKATISIRDAAGRQVQLIATELVKGVNQKDLNVAALPSGEYNVTIVGTNLNQTIKLSKIN